LENEMFTIHNKTNENLLFKPDLIRVRAINF
jgi:hypothetical protein